MSGTEKLATEEKEFHMELSQAAIVGLRDMLAYQEWAKGPKEQRKAMRCRRAIPKISRPEGADDMWGETRAPAFELPETLRDVGKKCLTWFSEQGKLLNNETVEELMDAFGVHE